MPLFARAVPSSLHCKSILLQTVGWIIMLMSATVPVHVVVVLSYKFAFAFAVGKVESDKKERIPNNDNNPHFHESNFY
uniref:Uncharacterized protein n=1 Tax=Solanum lycopersicum TaxID=4081 RepID=A0A3Q7GI08_SOLLC